MTVLSKFFVSRGAKFPAHGRVGKFRCGPTRWSINETPIKADKEKMKDIESDTLIIYRIAKKMKQENKDMYSG